MMRSVRTPSPRYLVPSPVPLPVPVSTRPNGAVPDPRVVTPRWFSKPVNEPTPGTAQVATTSPTARWRPGAVVISNKSNPG
jgi:hypothetical protein